LPMAGQSSPISRMEIRAKCRWIELSLGFMQRGVYMRRPQTANSGIPSVKKFFRKRWAVRNAFVCWTIMVAESE
jgi:hypothetical protein